MGISPSSPRRSNLKIKKRNNFPETHALYAGELPAAVDRARYFEAVAALEEAGRAEAATAAWGAALSQWPGDTVALFGLANANLALRNFAAAEDAYRTLLDRDSSLLAARNNLALALAEQGEFDAALQEISVALSENRDAAVDKELRDTEATIRRRKAIAD